MIDPTVRVEAGVSLVRLGNDPIEVLAAVAWGNLQARGETVSLCVKGLHPMTPENTYHRPGDNGKCCRACRAESARTRRSRLHRKEPCAYCGAPATAVSDNGTGRGHPVPRCRACYLAQHRT